MAARFTTDASLVSAEWLLEHVDAPDVRVVDATWFLPGTSTRSARDTYLAHHIPGARFLDIDEVADLESPLPHMLPSPEKFASRMRRLGLGDGHRIIVYDQNRLFASARAWWMFRVMGHGDVAVLDGGFAAWREAGGEIEDLAPPLVADRHFTARTRADLVRNMVQVREAVDAKSALILDARSGERFRGEVDEPRPGLQRGRIPGSRNLPFGDLLDASGKLLPTDELKVRLSDAGVTSARPVITTCGSGVSAAIIALALAVIGRDDVSVYDGSWAEWGGQSDPSLIET
ncbi:3-mercaptopyruvate sulfurtransferase [bacterium]|nr:3-mercaptopyruvate sulfurtransferase [bacterium]